MKLRYNPFTRTLDYYRDDSDIDDTFIPYTGATTDVNLGSHNLTTTGSITGSNLAISDWNTAYGWGDHSGYGYVTGTPWTGMGYITASWSANVDANGYSITEVGTINGTVVAGLTFEIGTAAQIKLTDGKLVPTTDNDINLGDATHEFKDAYFDGTVYLDGISLIDGSNSMGWDSYGLAITNANKYSAIFTSSSLYSSDYVYLSYVSGADHYSILAGGAIKAESIIKRDGTSSQFLKADGSVDSSTYLTALTGALLANGTVPLTADWAMGAFDLTGGIDATFSGTVQAEQLTSTDDISMAGYFNNVMGATDRQGIYVDGATNDFTAVRTGTSCYVNEFRRDYNVGTGNKPENIVNVGSYLILKHTDAELTASYTYAMNFTVYDTGKHTNTTAVSKTMNRYGIQGNVQPSCIIDATGVGGAIVQNIGLSGGVSDTTKLYDTGASGTTRYILNYGGDFFVNSNPTLNSGTWTISNKGVSINVTGTTTGSSSNYGLYITACSGADANYGLYDASVSTWVKAGGDLYWRTDGSKWRQGAGDDVYFSYTGTYWDWYVVNATSAIRVNQGQIDTDFIVYGDTGAMLTLDSTTLGAIFGGVVTLPVLAAAPGTLVNGMCWMEADGLHIYYNSAEKVVAGV